MAWKAQRPCLLVMLCVQLVASLQQQRSVHSSFWLSSNETSLVAHHGLRQVVGEFHDSWHSQQEPREHLKSPRCRNFYRSPGPDRSAQMSYDPFSKMFRPVDELSIFRRMFASKAANARNYQRMFTYEDKAVPIDFSDDFLRRTPPETSSHSDWCEMFAIRTAERPVKALTAHVVASGVQLALPAIWKCASTSFRSMLMEAQKEGIVEDVQGPHYAKHDRSCGPLSPPAQCDKHTTFDTDAALANVKIALVRNPLDRFLASVYEHGTWKTCDGDVCAQMVQRAKDMALRLATDFPHTYRSCEHPTQSYFLSATDSQGQPYNFDLILPLEDLAEHGLEKFKNATGVDLKMAHDNGSGNKAIKKRYFDAVFSDPQTLCAVCKVYAQDFECLGYEFPSACTHAACASVGVPLS